MNNKFSIAQITYALPTICYLLDANLLEKKAIIEWCDTIVLHEEDPDIFFIELSLMNSKSTKDVSSHLSLHINPDSAVISSKPVLAFIFRKFSNAEILFPEIIRTLYSLVHDTALSNEEKGFIYQLDHAYGVFQYTENQQSLLNIEKNVIAFLRIYKEYTLSNIESWQKMDAVIDKNFDEFIKSSRLTL